MAGELGGLHYCIVLNKDDKPSFGTLNVIPLTSIKENKRYYNNTVNLGNEIYTILYQNFRNNLTIPLINYHLLVVKRIIVMKILKMS